MNDRTKAVARWTPVAGLFGSMVLTGAAGAQTAQTQVTTTDQQQHDRFGSVSTEGDYLVVGSPGDSAQGLQTGAVHAYSRSFGGGGSWNEDKKIVASNPTNAAGFGTDVSLNGGVAFIGAPFETVGGALYIHPRNQGGINNWGELKRIPSPTGQTNDSFGWSVEARSTRVLVGSPEVFASNPGHAYIYEQNVGGFNNWGLLKTLQANPPVVRESFGESVALDTDSALVGAIGADDLATNAGAAYVFDRNLGGSNNWGQATRLLPSAPFPNGFFGMKVSISGDFAFVSAPGEDFGRGSVYVFQRHLGGIGNWGELQRIPPPQVTPSGEFGSSVSVRGTRALIGEEHGPDGGSVYLYELGWGGSSGFGLVKRINANNFGPGDEFGSDVELDGLDAMVGAPATPFGGSSFVGAAYWLDVPQVITAMPYGFCHTGGPCGNTDPNAGCTNSTGSGALISATGSSSVSLDDLVLTTTSVPANTNGIVFMGSAMTRVFAGDGLRVVGGQIIRLDPAVNSGPSGQMVFGPGIAGTQALIQPGTTWNFQTWFRDNAGPCGTGTNMSNGMSVSFVP